MGSAGRVDRLGSLSMRRSHETRSEARDKGMREFGKSSRLRAYETRKQDGAYWRVLHPGTTGVDHMTEPRFAVEDHVRMHPDFVKLGYSEYGVIEAVYPNETEQYLVRFAGVRVVRRVHGSSILEAWKIVD